MWTAKLYNSELPGCSSPSVWTNNKDRETLVPATLNARAPGEAVTTHFLQTNAALSLDAAHFPGGRGHQLPQVDGVVVE